MGQIHGCVFGCFSCIFIRVGIRDIDVAHIEKTGGQERGWGWGGGGSIFGRLLRSDVWPAPTNTITPAIFLSRSLILTPLHPVVNSQAVRFRVRELVRFLTST